MGLWADAHNVKCTYWPPGNPDGYGGDAGFTGGEVLDCRWEERSEEVVDKDGELVRSHSAVWTEEVLEVGGYLLRGESVEVDPTIVGGAHKIRRIRHIDPLFGDMDDEENVSFL